MHKLEEIIRNANKSGRQALIPFLTAGFPSLDRFESVLEELDTNGADIIEIGVPFSDPMADGPVVEAASVQALTDGMSLELILQILRRRFTEGKKLHAGLVLMGYVNPYLQYGIERFANDAGSVGVQGCIIPDLPLEEMDRFRKPLEDNGIALITLVGSNTDLARMQEYALVSQGYIYVVSVLGVTGERKGLPSQVVETLRRSRQAFSIPLALGFGLREPAQLTDLPQDIKPDAVIFGSALLHHISEGKSPKSFLDVWR